MLQNPRSLVKFFENFKLSKLPLFISILSKVLLASSLFSLFPPSTKTNHSSPPKESCKNKFFQDSIQKLCPKREPQMIQICLLKRRRRKEVKENPNSVAYGKFQCLVANGRFQCLVTFGRKKRNIIFTSSHFPPNNFT